MMQRLFFTRLALVAALWTCAASCPGQSTADEKPINFVSFLVDDLGCMDIAANKPDCFYDTPAGAMSSNWGYLFCPLTLGLADLSICRCAATGSQPAGSPARGEEPETVIFKMELADPVSTSTPARVYPVVQSKDRNGYPIGYALSVTMLVCTDQKCKPVVVTMYWNALGYYERIEHPPGKPLTKKEHVPFDAEDYAKLDRILKDRNSILGRISLAYLAEPGDKDTGVDAWSAATPITARESVVKDAAYTTWVMWRWANGEIVQKLRHITEQSCTPRYLDQLLGSEDRRDVDFALKYVTEHHPSDEQFLERVFHILENGDREHVTLSLRFLSGAMQDKKKLHTRLIDSCCRMKSMYSPMVLGHFADQPDLPPETLEGLTGRLDRLPYFQIHLILRLLEERKFFSETTESNIAQLLSNDDFFKARRAYEHLTKQDLSSETESKVNAFREQNRDRL